MVVFLLHLALVRCMQYLHTRVTVSTSLQHGVWHQAYSMQYGHQLPADSIAAGLSSLVTSAIMWSESTKGVVYPVYQLSHMDYTQGHTSSHTHFSPVVILSQTPGSPSLCVECRHQYHSWCRHGLPNLPLFVPLLVISAPGRKEESGKGMEEERKGERKKDGDKGRKGERIKDWVRVQKHLRVISLSLVYLLCLLGDLNKSKFSTHLPPVPDHWWV